MPQRVKPAEQGIVLDALSAGYGQTLIVDDINLTIPTGKMTVLAGANGSGKSTLLSTIARMLKPLGGCVRLDGQAIHQMPTKTVSLFVHLSNRLEATRQTTRKPKAT